MSDWIVIALVALAVAWRGPVVCRLLVSVLKDFKKASNELRDRLINRPPF